MITDGCNDIYEKIAVYAIDDTSRAQAYDSISLADKGELKATIARLYSFWGHAPLRQEGIRYYADFSAHEKIAPASYSIICSHGDSVKGTELVPALLPALLAGVEKVIPWFIVEAGGALSEDLLMTLELLGIEQAFSSSSQDFVKVLLEEIPLSCEDRLVLIGDCFADDTLCPSLLIKRGVPILSFSQGKGVYPALTPHWYCNHSIDFIV